MDITDDNMCFACGEENPISLGLDFELKEKNRAEAEFTPKKIHQGYSGIMHGGLISTLLDESMAKILSLKDINAVTAEMTVRFKKAVNVGEKLIITGILKENRGKLILTESKVENTEGIVKARAEAKFLAV